MNLNSLFLINVRRLILYHMPCFNWRLEFFKFFHLFLFVLKHSVILQSLQVLIPEPLLRVFKSLGTWFQIVKICKNLKSFRRRQNLIFWNLLVCRWHSCYTLSCGGSWDTISRSEWVAYIFVRITIEILVSCWTRIWSHPAHHNVFVVFKFLIFWLALFVDFTRR